MNTAARYVFLVLVVLVALHSLLSLTNDSYSRTTSNIISNARDGVAQVAAGNGKWWDSHPSTPPGRAVPEAYYLDEAGSKVDLNRFEPDDGAPPPEPPLRANATLIMVAKLSEADAAARAVRQIEDRFNRKYGYPWTIMSDFMLDGHFRKRIEAITSAPVTYVRIPAEHWTQPEWIDEDRASRGRQKLSDEGIIYGWSIPYRNQCRFHSGFFFRQPELQKYRWYWRVEPDARIECDIDFDPFRFMEDYNKTYGFTLAPYEFQQTVESLWPAVKEFMHFHPEYIARDNLINFVSDDGGESYNMCHFSADFQIADMDFWRSPAYTDFFEFLDHKGGIFYERWGDAPIHSIAAALFNSREQVHFFKEIGYGGGPNTHCPQDDASWTRGKCACDRANTHDYTVYSCIRRWEDIMS